MAKKDRFITCEKRVAVDAEITAIREPTRRKLDRKVHGTRQAFRPTCRIASPVRDMARLDTAPPLGVL